MHASKHRSVSPSKRALFNANIAKPPEQRDPDVLDKLEQEVQVLGNFHLQELSVEKALKDYLGCLRELSETEQKLSIEMKKLQPFASFNIWGNLFYEVGECHRELQELRADTVSQMEAKVLQSLRQPRNASEKQHVRKRLGHHVKKFRELTVKRAASVQHSDVTSHELIQSLRLEAVELQLQRDALLYTSAVNSQHYHTLLSTITQAVALEHQHHERACVRLLELQPMWRELQSANFAAPPDDVLLWIAANVPDVPPSLTRAISQRFLSGGSPRALSSRPLKMDSGPNSANASPRSGGLEATTSSLNLSPRQLEKQPVPPPGPHTRGLEPVDDPARPQPQRRIEPIDAARRISTPSSSEPPARTSTPPAQPSSPTGPAPLSTVTAPSAASPRSTGSDLGSRHALHRRIVDLEGALRDVRTALEKLQRTTADEELKGAIGNIILLATPVSPRAAASVGNSANLSLSPAPMRSSITVPATAPRHSRSGKRLSVAPTDSTRESPPLVALLADMPTQTLQSPTFLRLTQLLAELNKGAAAGNSPRLQRTITGVPAAPSTALQLHKGKPAVETGTEQLQRRHSVGPNPLLLDVLSQILTQIKLEADPVK